MLFRSAAAAAGFKKLELMSTAAGESLYQAQGFQVDERLLVATSGGVGVPLIRMSRQIVREA